MTRVADERLEIFDEDGRPAGLSPRSVVHRSGWWHRAANVFLFVGDGRLLIQRRQLTKDVCPGLWDVSVAEHLSPGETFEQGALRGLREELGIEIAHVEPVGQVVQSRLEIPALGLRDYEWQQSFVATFTATIRPDPNEVLETRAVTLGELATALASSPDEFTPWFRQRVADLRLLESSGRVELWRP